VTLLKGTISKFLDVLWQIDLNEWPSNTEPDLTPEISKNFGKLAYRCVSFVPLISSI